MNKIIDDFIDSTDTWLLNMELMKQDEGCVVCGIKPKQIKQLKEAVIELREKAWKYDELSK